VAYAQARALVPDQTFEVTFTDDQLTAAVNARLAESDSGQMIQDPVITFVPDEIDLAFTAGLGASGLGFEVAMAMSAGVDENGDVQVEVLSAEAGGAELQSDQMDILNDVMTKALVGAAAADVSDEVDLTITDIVIGEGTATVSGYVTPQG
jgi:uncharacterized protein YpmS